VRPAAGADGQAEPDEMAHFTASEHDGVVRAALAGEVDISNVRTIEAELHGLSNEAFGLVLDLSATTFIDSSAVSLLFGLRERLRRRGQILHLVAPLGTAPRRVLELTGYERAGSLDVDPVTAEQAIRAATAPVGAPAPKAERR
jgi:anti-anti-sigma factor